MEQVTITKTKNYIILKIPTGTLRQEQSKKATSAEVRAVKEGLKALREGRTSKPLKNAKEAAAFLRSL